MVKRMDFSERGKEIYWMTKDLRNQKRDLSENQKIRITIDKQQFSNYSEYPMKGKVLNFK